MATDNRTLLQKADLAISNLTSGGLLQPQQTDSFFKIMIKKAVLMNLITVTPMRGPTERRDKTRFGSRVLKPGAESTALPVGYRSAPDLSFIQLSAKLVKAEVRLSDEVLEDQIERGEFQNTIVELLAQAVARDVDFLISQGDTTSADPLLGVLNGFLKQNVTNVVNAGGVKLQKSVLRDMLKTMPDEFVDENLCYLTNRQAKVDYKDSLADCATPGGDAWLATRSEVTYSDYKISSIPEFPNALGSGTNETRVVLTDPKNMLLGVLRQVKVKTGEDIAAGQMIVVVSMRLDAQYMHEPASVLATGVFGV
jgi:HK97 family phage major capsid protein